MLNRTKVLHHSCHVKQTEVLHHSYHVKQTKVLHHSFHVKQTKVLHHSCHVKQTKVLHHSCQNKTDSLHLMISPIKHVLLQESVTDPGFPTGGANPKMEVPTYYLTNLFRKLHENIEILGQKGGRVNRAPLLDPPLEKYLVRCI